MKMYVCVKLSVVEIWSNSQLWNGLAQCGWSSLEIHDSVRMEGGFLALSWAGQSWQQAAEKYGLQFVLLLPWEQRGNGAASFYIRENIEFIF